MPSSKRYKVSIEGEDFTLLETDGAISFHEIDLENERIFAALCGYQRPPAHFLEVLQLLMKTETSRTLEDLLFLYSQNLDMLSNHLPDTHLDDAAWTKINNPLLLAMGACIKSNYLCSAIAGNIHTPSLTLRRLSDNPKWSIRFPLAQNPNCDAWTLRRLANDPSPSVSKYAHIQLEQRQEQVRIEA